MTYTEYQLYCSDNAQDNHCLLKRLCGAYEVVKSDEKIFDYNVDNFIESLKSQIYGTYEEIVTVFNHSEDLDVDNERELINFIGEHIYDICKDCEY